MFPTTWWYQVYEIYKAFGHKKSVYTPVAERRSKNSLDFVSKQLFETFQEW